MIRNRFVAALTLAAGALVMSRYGHPSKDAARERLLELFAGDSTKFGDAVVRDRAR